VQISDDDNDGDDGDGDLATDSFVLMSILSMYILPSANVNYYSILCHFRGKAKYWSKIAIFTALCCGKMSIGLSVRHTLEFRRNG